jgi:YggT family protein
MFVLANFLLGVAEVLRIALQIYMWLIIARAVLSWVSPDPYNPIVRFLYRSTDPVLLWVRRRVPLSFGGIDFSPILVILAIIFLQNFVVRSLVQVATSLSR